MNPGFGLSQGLVAVPKQGWLEQPLDPFNTSDRRTFLQVRLVEETMVHCTICQSTCSIPSLCPLTPYPPLFTLPYTPVVPELGGSGVQG